MAEREGEEGVERKRKGVEGVKEGERGGVCSVHVLWISILMNIIVVVAIIQGVLIKYFP